MNTKKISTTVNTGDTITNGTRTARIGKYKKGLIDIDWKINATSVVTDQISTRALNQKLKSGEYKIVTPEPIQSQFNVETMQERINQLAK